MAVRIITADERMRSADQRTTVFLVGPPAVGKTSQLYTLPAESTLALDFEGGFKSVETWKGDVVPLRSWEDAANLVCYIGGADPSITNQNDFYSETHYRHCVSLFGPNGTEQPIDLDKYRYIFFDSISELTTVAGKRARGRNLLYDKKTGRAMLDKNGEQMINIQGLYGDIARDVMTMVRHMQHCPGKNIIWVGKLHKVIDDFKRESWEPLLEGQRVGKDLPFVVDQVVTMMEFDLTPAGEWIFNPEKGEHRAFVCRRINPWGLPAKERTQGNIEMIEEPNLGKLIDKINQPAKGMTT